MSRKKEFQGEVVRRFQVTFNRPSLALRVSDEERIRQLRGIFADATGVTFGYIRAAVNDKTGKEIFLITFLNPDSLEDPRRKQARETIPGIVGKLTLDQVKKIVVNGTGLDPARIEVEEGEVKAGEVIEGEEY